MNAGTGASGTRANGTAAAKATADRMTMTRAMRRSCGPAVTVDKSVSSGPPPNSALCFLCARDSANPRRDGPIARSWCKERGLIGVLSRTRQYARDHLQKLPLSERFCEDGVCTELLGYLQVKRAT